jgi:hypothetical protein
MVQNRTPRRHFCSWVCITVLTMRSSMTLKVWPNRLHDLVTLHYFWPDRSSTWAWMRKSKIHLLPIANTPEAPRRATGKPCVSSSRELEFNYFQQTSGVRSYDFLYHCCRYIVFTISRATSSAPYFTQSSTCKVYLTHRVGPMIRNVRHHIRVI